MKNSNTRVVSQRCDVFQNVFDILLFAAHATKPFTCKDVQECVMEAPIDTVQKYLEDLRERGYIKRHTWNTFVSTKFTIDLLNVHGEIKP